MTSIQSSPLRLSHNPSKWRPVDGYEDRYEISDDGQVRNARGRILRLFQTVDGYLIVQLSGPKRNFRVPRLVAKAFIRDPLPGEQVNHIDFNKANNRVENLEWCTPSENVRHTGAVRGYPTLEPFKYKIGNVPHNRRRADG